MAFADSVAGKQDENGEYSNKIHQIVLLKIGSDGSTTALVHQWSRAEVCPECPKKMATDVGVSNIAVGPEQGGDRLITISFRTVFPGQSKFNDLELHTSDFQPAKPEIWQRPNIKDRVVEGPRPTPPPNPSAFRWSGSTVGCKDVSGIWSDPETGGTWTLTQTKNTVSGSLTIAKAKCGSVSWRVSGQVKDDVVTVTAAQPTPAIDKCGNAAATTITATVVPGCNRAAVKVETQH